MYVRRKWHLSYFVQRGFKRPRKRKTHGLFARFARSQYFARQPFAEIEYIACAGFSRGLAQRFPIRHIQPLMQKKFNAASRHPAYAVYSRRDDLGIVHYEYVVFGKVFGDIAEDAVLDLPCFSVEYEQSRRVTRLGGMLSYEFGRQIVIKIGCFQYYLTFLRADSVRDAHMRAALPFARAVCAI